MKLEEESDERRHEAEAGMLRELAAERHFVPFFPALYYSAPAIAAS